MFQAILIYEFGGFLFVFLSRSIYMVCGQININLLYKMLKILKCLYEK